MGLLHNLFSPYPGKNYSFLDKLLHGDPHYSFKKKIREGVDRDDGSESAITDRDNMNITQIKFPDHV